MQEGKSVPISFFETENGLMGFVFALFYIGVIKNSAFCASVNGKGEYYTCSKKDDFQNKLLELKGR